MSESADSAAHRDHAPLIARCLRAVVRMDSRELRAAAAEAGYEVKDWPKSFASFNATVDAIHLTAADLLESLSREAVPRDPELTTEVRLAMSVAANIAIKMAPDDFVGILARAYATVHAPPTDAADRLLATCLLIGLLVVDEVRQKAAFSDLTNASTNPSMGS